MPVELLSAALVANPVDAARVLGVLALEPDLHLIGPAGAFLISQFSRTGTALLLLGALTAWAVVPLLVSTIRFALPRASSRRAARLLGRAPLASPHPVSSSEATLS